MHSSSYKAFENGTIIFGQFFSTSRTCKDDSDNFYIDALKKSDSFIKQGTNIILKARNINVLTLSL